MAETAFQFPFSLPEYISAGAMMKWLLIVAFGFWALHTLIALYHWLRYSHASLLAAPAIALHLVMSFEIMYYGLTGALYLPF